MAARKLMVFPEELNKRFFKQLLDGQSEISISCVLLNAESDVADWADYVPPEAIACWSELLRPSSDPAVTPFHTKWYRRVLAELTSDSRTFYILERHYRALDKEIYFNSVFNRTIELELIVWNTLTLLERTRPDRIVHYNMPHGRLWFVARIAELTGVEILAGAVSPLPWKEWVVRGLDEQRVVTPNVPQRLSAAGRIGSFMGMVRGGYDVAMPSYEKERFDYFKGGFFSIRRELRSLLGTLVTTRSPFAVFTRALLSVRKWQVIKTYSQLVSGFKLPEKYVVFFLHYQPERTTLPEGGAFAQQWMALRAIASALPAGYKLLVKEHPSTFRYYFHPGFRKLDFHVQISQLPNTYLVPLALAPYPLIDRCVAAATVTGTVGVEAIIRGKPVLVFGAAQYRGQPGVYAVDSAEAVQAALTAIEAGAYVLKDGLLDAYMDDVDKLSFPIWEGTWPGALTPDLTVASREVMQAAIYADTMEQQREYCV
jgi:hypothetical protein